MLSCTEVLTSPENVGNKSPMAKPKLHNGLDYQTILKPVSLSKTYKRFLFFS